MKFTVMGMVRKSEIFPANLGEFKASYSFNSGNMLFNYGVDVIAECTTHKFPWSIQPDIVNNHKSTQGILIPMANHIGSHVDLGEKGPRIELIKKPIVILGIGAQFPLDTLDLGQVPRGTIDWLNSVTHNGKYKNISVRGEFTAEVLDNLGFSNCYEVLGCPSHLISSKHNLGQFIWDKYKKTSRDKKLKSLAVAAGNPFRSYSFDIEKFLIEMVNKFGADYVIQHPKILIEACLGYQIDESDKSKITTINKRWFPELNESQMIDFFKNKSRVYISVPQWMLDLSKKEFVVGTRIHGVQAAIQAGTPAVCIYIDSRTKELCDTMHIPCVSVNDMGNINNINDLFDIFEKWDPVDFDHARNTIALNTKAFLESNSVSVSSHLRKLCV